MLLAIENARSGLVWRLFMEHLERPGGGPPPEAGGTLAGMRGCLGPHRPERPEAVASPTKIFMSEVKRLVRKAAGEASSPDAA